ncbi:hypothetical protein DESC_610346 [Desulfosarcina cetonica]|nr:hypothetical protein DESC_610346 [Desulfosarcina cetonica]
MVPFPCRRFPMFIIADGWQDVQPCPGQRWPAALTLTERWGTKQKAYNTKYKFVNTSMRSGEKSFQILL